MEILGRGSAWFDTEPHESFQEASLFVSTIQKRQGLIIGSPEEVSWRMGWISDKKLFKLIQRMKNNDYSSYLQRIF